MLREFLLRGGTATFDDFHGPYEWEISPSSSGACFPIATIVEIEPRTSDLLVLLQARKYPQIPGIGSFMQGRTWEKGGFVAAFARHSRRQWSADGAHQLEHRHGRRVGVVERGGYPGLPQVDRQAYQMVINEIVYSLTH